MKNDICFACMILQTEFLHYLASFEQKNAGCLPLTCEEQQWHCAVCVAPCYN